MNYYLRHIGDYLKDTAHLSLLEHGVYTRLLDVYYTRESGVPDTEVARLIQARTKDEKAALQAVLSEFFTLENGVWSQARSEREISDYRQKSEKASRSAIARWKMQRAHSEGNANAMRTHSEGNAPINQEPITNNQKQEKKKRRASAQTPLPQDFSISPRVVAWAEEKGHGRLTERFEHFVSYAKRSGKTYADWDEAFMGAVREDWAKLGNVVPIRPSHHDEFGRPRVAV